MDWTKDLVVAAPAAAAVIIVVAMFLKFLREERVSRDVVMTQNHKVMGELRDSIKELSLEIRQQATQIQQVLKR